MHQVGGVALLIPLAAFLAGRGRTAFSFKTLRIVVAMLLLFAVFAFFLGYGHKVFGGPAKSVIETEETAVDIGGQKLVLSMFKGGLAWKMVKALFGWSRPARYTLQIVKAGSLDRDGQGRRYSGSQP